MSRMVTFLLLLLLIPVLYVGGLIALAYVTRYQPQPVEALSVQRNPEGPVTDSTFRLLIWNLGYGGLGEKADFFYDGGKRVRSPKEEVEQNQQGIRQFLSAQRPDFILLQEADRASRRSWYIDQATDLANALPEYGWSFAANYDVPFVPVPYTQPMGKVYGGLLSFHRYAVSQASRIQLPIQENFPDYLFYLQRCLLMQRVPLANGKELVVINTHFEAYDDGQVKKEQMAFTKKILLEEYGKGNYVVLGGDWNISPPDVDPFHFAVEQETDYKNIRVEADYMPGWQFACDSAVATNRKLKTPYVRGKTFTTVIDYFLLSPNLEKVDVKGIDLGFRFSDHQPVLLQLRLRQ